jgi:NAD-dependent deacetylase
MAGRMPPERQVAALVLRARRLVVLTGAGISTNAGIPDFRGAGGIYTTGRYPADVFDIDRFRQDPSAFFAYARDYVAFEERVRPTFTHLLLARWEQAGRLLQVLTQNIDGLHQKAGSRAVLELHGGYQKNFCMQCRRMYDFAALKRKLAAEAIPHCDACGGVIKPDIVFFGEPVPAYEEAARIAAACDCLLVIGTSLTVYPAALLPELVRGTVVVVTKGGRAGGAPGSLQVDADIDEFFRKVAQEVPAP